MDGLLSTETLAGMLGAENLLVLDATYTSTIPGAAKQDPRAEFEAAHIPGARLLDLDTLVDAENPLPSTAIWGTGAPRGGRWKPGRTLPPLPASPPAPP